MVNVIHIIKDKSYDAWPDGSYIHEETYKHSNIQENHIGDLGFRKGPAGDDL